MKARGLPFEWLAIPEMDHSGDLEQLYMIARAVRWFVRCHLGEMSPDSRIPWRGRQCEPAAGAPQTTYTSPLQRDD
jgi:hypothetical protein